MTPIVRFAPSPTGLLHIGSARTALFNWVFAQKTGGKMLLRIEDTDRSRSTEEATQQIFEGLSWLGFQWDGEPVSQFSRKERHKEIAEQLLQEGKAYRCFATSEELEEMRALAEKEGRSPRYDGRWRTRDPQTAPPGVPFAIRFKAQQEGETVLEDHVQGRVVFPNKDLDDLIILRSDGTPTYNLSVVVDDHDMAVTHIIRGVDHLTNAARQMQIYQAMGWNIPRMAHIPLIHGPDGAKLSKRHGAMGVEAYREMGYLPQALGNYLARLGWSHGDDEIFSLSEMISWFTLEAIGKSPARFDFVKLENINFHYMKAMHVQELFDTLLCYLPWAGAEGTWFSSRLNEQTKERLHRGLPFLQERAKTLKELLQKACYLLDIPFFEPAALEVISEKKTLLERYIPVLEKASWTDSSLETSLKTSSQEFGLKLGAVGPAFRAALTGSLTAPGISSILWALGKDESLKRLKKVLS